MTRGHEPPSERPSAASRSRGSRTAYVPTAYEIRDSAGKALAQLGLAPGDARLVVIPASARAERKLTQSAESRRATARRFATSALASIAGTTRSKRPVIDKTAFAPNARSRALLEGVRIAQGDLRTAGGAYDLHQVQILLHGISRQRVVRRVNEHTLLAVPGPSNRRVYPTIQFMPDGTVVDGLKAVLEALPTHNPWAALNFLIQPDHRLHGRTPIDVLKAGKVARVVEAARRVSDQGA